MTIRTPTPLFALIALACAVPAQADTLQDQVLAGTRAARPDAFAFRRTTVADRSGAARKTFVEQYDPARALAERWSLISVDGKAPTAKEIANARKAARGPVPSYHENAKWFGAPATRVAATAGSVTYRFAKLPAGTLKIGSHDASADTIADAVVNTAGRTPFIETVRFTTTKPFRMALVAKVERIAALAHYRQLADGRAVPVDTVSDIAGSLLGKSGQIRVAMTYGDFQPR